MRTIFSASLNYILLILFSAVFTVHAQNSLKMHVIDNSLSGADGVKLADTNNDGIADITTGWEEGVITKIYFPPGFNSVNGKWPSVIAGKTPNVEDAVFADMNNDGKSQPVWQDGKMGFRQMQWTYFRYRNFKFWSLKN